jgi:hypothetical protein
MRRGVQHVRASGMFVVVCHVSYYYQYYRVNLLWRTAGVLPWRTTVAYCWSIVYGMLSCTQCALHTLLTLLLLRGVTQPHGALLFVARL